MNRAELAELLAGTQSPARSQHSTNTSAPAIGPPASLSPRQLFQSRIRTLSEDGLTSPSRSPGRPRNELQRLSTFRVHVTSPQAPKDTASPHKHAHATRDGRFGYSPYEPDLVTEERAAWTAIPPKKDATRNETVNIWTDIDEAPLRLSQNSRSSLHASAPAAPRLVFGPSSQSAVGHERPKTSRGNSMPGAFPNAASESDTTSTNTHKSKFFEGSMNERSVGVSSSWEVHGERLSEEHSSAGDDSDSTPRASRFSTDSFTSTDLAEFRPSSNTPATLKQRLSRLASSFKLSEDINNVVDAEQTQKKRKGLRKSISTWSFHSLGEKVKFFGSSASDTTGPQGQTQKKGATEQLDVLTERKRKAEEAYAEQFGAKKQKTNDGIAAEDRNRTIRGPPRTLKKRSVSRQQTPTARRRRNVSASTIIPIEDPADISEADDLDLRKRPSRRELEKENHQLRALLREQQAQSRGNLQLSASRSSVHLPIEDPEEATEAMPASTVTRPNKTQKRQEKAGVPPVPPLPTKAILATLGTKGPNRPGLAPGKAGSTWKDTGTMKRVTRSSKPSPPVEVLSENFDPAQTPSAPKEEWQWPDDVF